jgi:hypothetical protein
MALVRPGQTALVEIARRIARKMSRSAETIRLTLKAYDRDHPDRAIFPHTVPPLDDEAKRRIANLVNHQLPYKGKSPRRRQRAVILDQFTRTIWSSWLKAPTD